MNQEDKAELKPCPFCGGDNVKVSSGVNTNPNGREWGENPYFVIFCDSCGYIGKKQNYKYLNSWCNEADLNIIQHNEIARLEMKEKYEVYENEARQEAVRAWNARPIEDALQKERDSALGIVNLPPEGERTKLEEWQACYAALFRQLNTLTSEPQAIYFRTLESPQNWNTEQVNINPNDVIKFLKATTGNHRWMNGDCYRLYNILKAAWPSAEAYYDTDFHIYTKIGDSYYDIRGETKAPEGAFNKLDEDKELLERAKGWRYEG